MLGFKKSGNDVKGEDGYDWPDLLNSFTESLAGQMIIEEGWGYKFGKTENGEPIVVVDAPLEDIESLANHSPVPLASNRPNLEID